MSTWIRADYAFDEPCASIVIPERKTQEVTTFLRENRSNPEAMCKWLAELIEYERPNLKGVVLYGVQFDLRRLSYVVWAVHPSLPKRSMANEPEEIRL